MAKVDPRLRLVMEEIGGRSAAEIAGAGLAPLGERIGWSGTPDETTIEILVEGARDANLNAVGAEVPGVEMSQYTAGSVRPMRLPVTALRTLAEHEAVDRIEASRPLFAELNWSRVECRAEAVHTSSPPLTGAGVVVAVLDSGIDYTHPCFRRSDGSTRIIALWDQAADAAADGAVTFGREYRKAELDTALSSTDPLTVVPHTDRDPNGHGTHVAGIVAGDERGRPGAPPDLFTGIAPDAELIVVALDVVGNSLGTSPRVVAALDYVRRTAGGRPVVVNLSQGTNIGGHSGDSLLERRIDELSREPGFVVVKSAGNERQWGTHAGGRLSPGEDHFLDFDVVAANRLDDIIEVWFAGGDDIEVSVSPPNRLQSAFVRQGDSLTFDTATGNRVRIDVDENADGTQDGRASLILRAGTAGQLQPGRWSVVLRSGVIRDGLFDAWIERAPRVGPAAPEQSRFAPTVRDASRTITIPGTAHRIITVGSYITKSQFPETIGAISGFSSVGPTRDGRTKPDLAAPGEFVTSARSGWRDDGIRHIALAGTSMSAPHVAGTVALVLQAAPLLTADQVGQILRRAARTDRFVDEGTDGEWGGGKLDAAAAVGLARTAVFPAVTAVQVEGSHVSVTTDLPTTARLRVRGAQSADLDSEPTSTIHTFDLAGLASGQHHCSVEVTAEGWITLDDNGGHGHAIQVGESVTEPHDAGFDDIAGITRVIAERLGREGIATLEALADSTTERLAEASGVPFDTVRQQDWTGQARKLAADGARGDTAAPEAGARHTFTVVAVTRPNDRQLIEFDVTDSRTNERATKLDGPALLSFLQDKTAEAP